jgi:predicted metal-dependent peptidase
MRLDKAIKILLNEKPFYAYFLINSTVLWDAYGVETAAAGVMNATPTLLFNSKFVSTLTTEELAGVIEHEVEHLVHDHVNTGKNLSLDKHIHNIATDWSINQRIKVLPECAITHESMEKKLEQQIEKYQDSIFYYNLLLKNQDKIKDLMPMDDHDLEELIGKLEKSGLSQAAIKEALSKAIKQANGNVPEHLKNVISSIMKPQELPWQQILRNFISTSTSSLNLNTRKKINRRFGLDAPGKKKKRVLNLAVCVDSSGSVSDELFSQFLSEIYHITKHTGSTYLIEIDCEIKKVEKLKKKTKINERTGYGGTAYNPGLKKAKELGCDAVVYMGDGDCADTPENPKMPVLWVLPKETKCPANFGKTLYI